MARIEGVVNNGTNKKGTGLTNPSTILQKKLYSCHASGVKQSPVIASSLSLLATTLAFFLSGILPLMR